MAAVQDSDAIAPDAHARRWIPRVVPVVLAVTAGYALTLLVFYPGYVTIDATYVYADAQAWQFGDWQSPAMAVLWGLIDPVAPGSLSMVPRPLSRPLGRRCHKRFAAPLVPCPSRGRTFSGRCGAARSTTLC